MIRVSCKCGSRGQVPPTHAGKQIKCRKCGSMIAVPTVQAVPIEKPAAQASPFANLDSPGISGDESPYRADPGPRYPGCMILLGLGAVVLGVVSFVLYGSAIFGVIPIMCGGGLIVWTLIRIPRASRGGMTGGEKVILGLRLARLLPALIIVSFVPIAIGSAICSGFFQSLSLTKPATGSQLAKQDRDEPTAGLPEQPNKAPEEPAKEPVAKEPVGKEPMAKEPMAKMPEPAEPAPKGWVVLFRSDDPSVWNTESAGENFAIPIARAPRAARFLRLTRRDTGEALIVASSYDELASPVKSFPAEGSVWNGAPPSPVEGKLIGKNVRVLGIAEGPATRLPGPADMLIVAFSRDLRCCRGSGFAAKMSNKLKPVDQQFYCWKGQPIAKTAFEIAVTADPLTDAEKALLVK
jgi:hypothetical protein